MHTTWQHCQLAGGTDLCIFLSVCQSVNFYWFVNQQVVKVLLSIRNNYCWHTCVAAMCHFSICKTIWKTKWRSFTFSAFLEDLTSKISHNDLQSKITYFIIFWKLVLNTFFSNRWCLGETWCQNQELLFLHLGLVLSKNIYKTAIPNLCMTFFN